ncbi:cyclic nucleotide-binding domain-containing protein, partial [Chroococcidiopsis sp. SAG 2025]|uniref:cyclic nucleotide-binding domain-containing protein n=1 Tax=Chroococcidiopsis sp. SAG 2025 TaxID=171389 RepID=UPI0029373565
MVQNSFTTSVSKQQLAETLGQVLPEPELDRCLKHAIIQEPAAGKQFWQAADAEPGIYIIIAGKVRLLDNTNDLLVTLETGASFGESTLFPTGSFQPYSARASVNLKLYYLPNWLLQDLSHKYPSIQKHLYRQAVLRDWLLLCPQIAALRKLPGLMKALSLLERHELPVGQLPSALKNQKLWLLRRGQLVHTSGLSLTQGSIYTPSLLKGHSWQVDRPTELYSLNETQWKTALDYLPQLEQLLSSDTLPVVAEEQGDSGSPVPKELGIGGRGAGVQVGRAEEQG